MTPPTDPGNGRQQAGCGDRFAPSAEDTRQGEGERNPFEPLFHDLGALQAYAAHYVAARADALRFQVRKGLGWATLGLLAVLVGAAIVITAAVFLVSGIAAGFTALFGGRVWAGDLLASVFLLLVIGGGAYLGVQSWIGATYQKTKEKYERRREHQREAFGLDVTQRGTAEPAASEQ